MLDFLWRALGYTLEKDLIRKHQLHRAKVWESGVKKEEKEEKETFTRVAIENSPRKKIKKSKSQEL
tara:strand:+ start:4316 stop:4513 length:198 start_codon:yes stop_codon:yes gene_type:complete